MTPMMETITEKIAVHIEWSESVFRTFAPVRMWNPISMILFARSMKPEKT